MARCRKMVKGKGGRSRQCRNTSTNGKTYCHAHGRRRSRSRSRTESFPGSNQAGGAGEIERYTAISNQMKASLRELCSLAARPNMTSADRDRIAILAMVTGRNANQANALEKEMAGAINEMKGNLARLDQGITKLNSDIKNMRTVSIDNKFNAQKKEIDQNYSKQIAQLNAAKARENKNFNAQIAKMNQELAKMSQQRNTLQNQIKTLTGGVTQMQRNSQSVANTMTNLPRKIGAPGFNTSPPGFNTRAQVTSGQTRF